MPTAETLQIDLINQTASNEVYAYITGLAIDHNNSWFLLSADGKTPFYPSNPPSIGTPVPQDCAIRLGPPGQSRSITIPHIAGGRIYLSVDKTLTFFLNPGPALVEPSVTNPSDPNSKTNWGFCEFTYNSDQLYANISYVDFVSLPVSLNLVCGSGEEKKVLGMPKNGLDTLAAGLEQQSGKDGQGWKELVIKDDGGKILRILSPNQGMVMNPNLLTNYFEPYIDEVWNKYSSAEMKLDTQAAFGTCCGRVENNTELKIDEHGFAKPCTRDVFNASSGPFQTGADAKRNAIIPRLNAAFNRSTLLCSDTFPAAREHHYKHEVTNHYARLVHEGNIDGRGYAHPYDDVAPSGGPDQSGFVNDGGPKVLVITVGGIQ